MINKESGQERTNKREQVCGNLVSSVDANTFTLWEKMEQLNPNHPPRSDLERRPS